MLLQVGLHVHVPLTQTSSDLQLRSQVPPQPLLTRSQDSVRLTVMGPVQFALQHVWVSFLHRRPELQPWLHCPPHTLVTGAHESLTATLETLVQFALHVHTPPMQSSTAVLHTRGQVPPQLLLCVTPHVWLRLTTTLPVQEGVQHVPALQVKPEAQVLAQVPPQPFPVSPQATPFKRPEVLEHAGTHTQTPCWHVSV